MSQGLFHSLSFSQLINELIRVAYLLHKRVFDIFFMITADNPFDLINIGIELRGQDKEVLKICFIVRDPLQCC